MTFHNWYVVVSLVWFLLVIAIFMIGDNWRNYQHRVLKMTSVDLTPFYRDKYKLFALGTGVPYLNLPIIVMIIIGGFLGKKTA